MKLDSKDFNERGRDFIEVYPQYHVSNFPDNQPVTRMSRKEPAQAAMPQSQLADDAETQKKQASIKIQEGQTRAIERYMHEFSTVANATIRNHNKEIYDDFTKFLTPERADDFITGGIDHGVTGLQIRGVTNLRNQVPTCLVVTSNESVTSVEAQFNALTVELRNRCKAISLILDEKKCDCLKSTVEHIQARLKQAVGLHGSDDNRDSRRNADPGLESGDEVNLEISAEPSSDEEMAIDEVAEPKPKESFSSRHVSTLQDISLDI